jgi:hypothetical protein
VVTARQQYCKHVSVAPDTDATVEDAVFSMWPLLGNSTINTFLQQRINRGTVGRGCILCGPCRGYITRISSRNGHDDKRPCIYIKCFSAMYYAPKTINGKYILTA